tara:strand:+ start:1323 stop:1703 length:381 start_codon:yes stop_codon:yes gene_type:complete
VAPRRVHVFSDVVYQNDALRVQDAALRLDVLHVYHFGSFDGRCCFYETVVLTGRCADHVGNLYRIGWEVAVAAMPSRVHVHVDSGVHGVPSQPLHLYLVARQQGAVYVKCDRTSHSGGHVLVAVGM